MKLYFRNTNCAVQEQQRGDQQPCHTAIFRKKAVNRDLSLVIIRISVEVTAEEQCNGATSAQVHGHGRHSGHRNNQNKRSEAHGVRELQHKRVNIQNATLN